MNTCKSCRWWNSRANRFTKQRACDNPRLISFGEDGLNSDDFGQETELETGPDFGCIHWDGELAEQKYPQIIDMLSDWYKGFTEEQKRELWESALKDVIKETKKNETDRCYSVPSE
jgi:hypothetical protein